MELMIPLNTQDVRPLYEQIYQYIKDEIRSGKLPSGKRLPSSRELAKGLKVSRSTTQLAYEQLVSEGYLEAKPRKGYFTAELDGILPPVRGESRVRQPVQDSRRNGALHRPAGRFAEALQSAAADPGAVAPGSGPAKAGIRIDFSPRGIDLDSFPFSTWRKISRAVLREEERELFLKGDPQGDLPLRLAIRDYLYAARGVSCDASQIVVGAGNEYLLMLLSGLLGRNTGIAMENPTYRQAYQVFSDMGHAIYPVEMDESGFMTEELLKLSDRVNTVYVTPSHQFPMGIVMPVKRRQELLSWAAGRPGRFLIEDDYDSEFRYKGKPIPALQGLDARGTVVYMGTFSKAIAPAIRVGYLVLPPALLAAYQKQAGFYSSTVSRVDQRILTQFITGGYFERHLNRMREIYKGKHDLLLAALKPLEPFFTIEGENAGLHVLLTYRGEKNEEELVEAAARAGVKIYGLSGFFIHKEHRRYPKTVVLGYARLNETEILEGAALLSQALGREC
ncbi:MAG: PLP-dependent aminotransferase family protein [Lachnospiraceae bacterium]|nr:PLP-dependent aminotransferase family protein [Lachnospiraceae bacterium]